MIPQFPIRIYLAQSFQDRQLRERHLDQPGDFSIGGWGLKFVISLGGGTCSRG